MINNFLSLPNVVLFLFVLLFSSVISISALVIIRKKFHWEIFKENHEVGGFLFNALGLIYAVLVAFVVFATWTAYDSASNNADEEANQLHDLFLDSQGLPQQYRQKTRETILEYLRSVINEEWEMLSIGEPNPKSKEILIKLYNIYLNMDSLNSPREQAIYSESLKRLNVLTDYRRLRILASQQHIPGVIWAVLIIGASISIGFTLFFGTKNLILQSIMTALFATTNAIVLLLILILDHPFTGDGKITSEPFQAVLSYLQKYLTGM